MHCLSTTQGSLVWCEVRGANLGRYIIQPTQPNPPDQMSCEGLKRPLFILPKKHCFHFVCLVACTVQWQVGKCQVAGERSCSGRDSPVEKVSVLVGRFGDVEHQPGRKNFRGHRLETASRNQGRNPKISEIQKLIRDWRMKPGRRTDWRQQPRCKFGLEMQMDPESCCWKQERKFQLIW